LNRFDLAFVGNGIVAIVAALCVKRTHPDLSVAIVGPKQRPFSASAAAGAMHAAFCEVEETFNVLRRDRTFFEIALEARPLWHELIKTFGIEDAVTAQSTVMFRRKQGTLFEEANFDAACTVADQYQALEAVTSDELDRIFCGDLKPTDVIAKKFMGEFALDPSLIFDRAQGLLEGLGVTFIDDKVKIVDLSSKAPKIVTENQGKIQAARLVMAAGTETSKLLPEEIPLVPLYHAVGTSMVLDSAPAGYRDLKMVVRTPNRGGAQCGMHIVPRGDGRFYLGAGNYLSDQTPAHRMETVRYLIEICNDELYGKQAVYNAKAEFLLGSRPKSVDGYPMVGALKDHPNVFVATGMYRIGLTIAPVVAVELCRWYDGKAPSDKFTDCLPDRKLNSYAPMGVATRYYSESRISNLIEHGILDPSDSQAITDKKRELEAVAENWNAEIVKRHGFANDFVVDPDMYSILMAAGAN
jgi:glycine/D-amino acid oxidase-like deaminating enzyme